MSQLKIVSWNIWGGKNLKEIIRILKDTKADIIGLQEVLQDENGENNCAEVIAETLGYEYIYETTTLLTPSASFLLKEQGIGKPMGWGNAILSKYKITKSKTHILSDSHKRTAVEATIEIGDKNIRVFSTHLMYNGLQPSEIQITQIKNLLKIVPEKLGIVTGDFNVTPESEVIAWVNKVMTNTESDLTKVTWGHFMPHLPTVKRKLDYIFITKDIKNISSGVLDSDASDHFPIYSVIEI